MAKCDIKGCEKPMNVMHPTKPRVDGGLFENLDTGRAYHICNECIEKLGLIAVRKK